MEQETPHEAEHDHNSERRDKDIAMDQYKKRMQELWASPLKDPSQHSWKTAVRHRFCLAFDEFKGDPQLDAAAIPLNHLYLLHVSSREDERLFSTGFAVAKNFNKAYTNHSRYSFVLRERDVNICPVSALAFHLLAKFSVCIQPLLVIFLPHSYLPLSEKCNLRTNTNFLFFRHFRTMTRCQIFMRRTGDFST